MLTTDALHHAEDVVHQDLIGICLAASYLTGLSATISREAPMSEMMMLQKSQHFPPRAADKTREDCSAAIAGALHWIDLYIHASHSLGPVSVQRFKSKTFWGLNAFSLN